MDRVAKWVEWGFTGLALLALIATFILLGCELFGCRSIEQSAGNAMKYAIEGGVDRALGRISTLVAPPPTPPNPIPSGGVGDTWLEIIAGLVSFTIINVGHRIWYHRNDPKDTK